MKMKTIRLQLLTVMAAMFSYAMAQGPNGSEDYYKDADGLNGNALKNALTEIIKDPSVTSYDGLKKAYKKTDKRADGKVRDWYSNVTNYTFDNMGGNASEGAGWNREHLVPQSWFEGNSSKPKSDIMQVVPTDSWVNNMRGNFPLAEVGTIGSPRENNVSRNEYSKRGTCKTPGYSGTVFEPNDKIKGDIARIYFYMAICYADDATSWGHAVFSTVKSQSFQKWYLDMLLQWSKLDPIDDVEIARNNAAYGVQSNRNPFVDYPGLEEYIWGDSKDKVFSYDNYEGDEPGDEPGDDYATIKVTDALVAAYSSNQNLDFTGLEGISAWTATSFGDNSVKLSRVYYVPKGTGIYVKAEKEGEYQIPTTDTEYYYANMFVGLPKGGIVERYVTHNRMRFINLYLAKSKSTGKPTFFPITEKKEFEANKMYLSIPSYLVPENSSARSFSLEFIDR